MFDSLKSLSRGCRPWRAHLSQPQFRRPVETRRGGPAEPRTNSVVRTVLPMGKTHRPFTLEHPVRRHQNAAATKARAAAFDSPRKPPAPSGFCGVIVVKPKCDARASVASAPRDTGMVKESPRSLFIWLRYPQLFAAAVLTACMRSLPSSTARPMVERISLSSAAAVSHLAWCAW